MESSTTRHEDFAKKYLNLYDRILIFHEPGTGITGSTGVYPIRIFREIQNKPEKG